MTDSLISNGAETDDPAQILRKYLHPGLQGDVWDALIAALANGDEYVRETARLAFNQLFISSAEGPYLIREAADLGIVHPAGIGISSEVFRNFAIKANANKQIEQVLLEVLETFYGSEATRANSISGVAGPYVLGDGYTLEVAFENDQSATITFNTEDFTSIGAATPLEITAVINRELTRLGYSAWAVVRTDRSNNDEYVQIFSGALGLYGFVQITGGRAQNILQFATQIATTNATGTAWDLEVSTSANDIQAGRVRLTWTGGTNPSLYLVNEGDYVNIFGSSFTSGNRGSYPIVEVGPDYFDFESLTCADQSATQVANADVRFFTPTKSNISLLDNVATVSQGDPDVLDVSLPVTTQAIERTATTAAYLHGNESIAITAASRNGSGVVTVTATGHGLSTGDWVEIDELYPDNTVAGAGGLNGLYKITVTGANSFTYVTPEFQATTTALSGGTATPTAAESDDRPGPFVFDPDAGLAITGEATTVTQDVVSGFSYRILTVTDATDFPDETGYLMFDFGGPLETAPVKYLAKISSTELLIDPGYLFPINLPSGTRVVRLTQRTPFDPASMEISKFYVTGAAEGRVAASDAIDQLVAAGLTIDKNILYPGDRGLGNEGYPASGSAKLSDKVQVWAGDDVDSEVEEAQEA
jgi:hypothetical protein